MKMNHEQWCILEVIMNFVERLSIDFLKKWLFIKQIDKLLFRNVINNTFTFSSSEK